MGFTIPVFILYENYTATPGERQLFSLLLKNVRYSVRKYESFLSLHNSTYLVGGEEI